VLFTNSRFQPPALDPACSIVLNRLPSDFLQECRFFCGCSS
jgi:hypothetical protein